VYVACSTLCFSKYPLEQALRKIAELEFGKFEIAIHEESPHLRPSEVASDVMAVAQRLRMGPGLAPVAFSLQFTTADEAEHLRQLQAVCRLARVCAAPVVTIPAAPRGVGVDGEVERLGRLVKMAQKEGILLNVSTLTGSLTEDPNTTVTLCQRVAGLGLTLDPSHYLSGPHQGQAYDQVFPYVRHLHLRDTGRGPNQFQVRVGQGEVEYGRIVAQLARHRYDRILTVDIRDVPESAFAMEPEVRKLKYLLESLV
jgi:sugar phosphate isomerase/epimerase